MNSNTQIINNLKKAAENIQIEAKASTTGYEKKEISLRYSIKNSLVNEKERENDFYYKDSKEKIEELMKKEPLEIFDFLAQKQLEKNTGYGNNPKRFQTPCPLCNQKTLTTLGWSEPGYPNNLERFFCRLCRTSFGWIDIKDDPVEFQQEMLNYYRVFQQKELAQDGQKLKEISEELSRIINRINKNCHSLQIEQRTPI